MRILAFYPYIPYPLNRGAYQRAFYLLKELARDHEIDMLALAENCEGVEHQGVFAEFCRSVRVIPFHHPPWPKLFPKRLSNPLPSTVTHWTLPSIEQVVSELLEKGDYDAVYVFDLILAQYFLKDSRCPMLVVDRTRVDLQYQLMEQQHMGFSLKNRILNVENLLKLWRYERTVAKQAKLEIVCGPDDESFVKRFISRKVDVAVIPNGVDITYFHPNAGKPEDRAEAPTILFCGAMDYNPNVDALRWYFAEIDDRLRQQVPDLKVLIVGKDPIQEVRNYARFGHVTVTGGVPDVRPYYQRAWLQIVPLRIGGGTRLKIVESMAMGTPVVSTTIGAQGLDLRHEHDVLLADTADHFIHCSAKALKDSELRNTIRKHGLATANGRLAWPVLGTELRRIFHNIRASAEPLELKAA